MKKEINIKNKKAYHNYEFIENYCCGICLQGTEIKSIREGNVSFSDAYCYFENNELQLKNVHIDTYKDGKFNNHEPKRDRKLLLTKKELKKLEGKVKEGGVTIVPTRLFINDQGFCKIEIALAKGKKDFDKRNSKLEKEEKIKINREYKINI